ncbi:MAG: hypothetical protein KJ971_05025 [Firmicutes bacterium]|nr:hypothetical protein [Bacillota bacterium]
MNFIIDGNLSHLANYDNLLKTVSDVYIQYATLFGTDTMSKIKLYIDNVANFEKANSGYTPMIIPIFNEYLFVKLGIPDFGDTAKIIYQFSHELAHYVFYSLMGFDKPFADYEEEVICTAFSLSMIKKKCKQDVFENYCNYVNSVEEEQYRDGYSLGIDYEFNLHNLKIRLKTKAMEY